MKVRSFLIFGTFLLFLFSINCQSQTFEKELQTVAMKEIFRYWERNGLITDSFAYAQIEKIETGDMNMAYVAIKMFNTRRLKEISSVLTYCGFHFYFDPSNPEKSRWEAYYIGNSRWEVLEHGGFIWLSIVDYKTDEPEEDSISDSLHLIWTFITIIVIIFIFCFFL